MPSQGVPLPPPYKGQNDLLPEFSVQNPFCILMQNFEVDTGLVKLRQGNENYADLAAGTLKDNVELATFQEAIFVIGTNNAGTQGRIYQVGIGVLTLVDSIAGNPTDYGSLFFGNRLFVFFSPFINPRVFDGSTWGAAGYTWPASFVPIGGCVHKNRAYFVNLDTAKYGYSNVDAISGAVTEVDLSTVISKRAELYGIRSISTTEATTPENLLAFLFSSGEILVYGGSYPGSASWGLVARLEVSELLYNNAFVEAKGDTFILTKTEVLSLRNLITRGYSDERQNGIGAVIANRYAEMVSFFSSSASTLRQIKGVYDKGRDRLLISFPGYGEPGTSGQASSTKIFYLGYDFKLGAWYENKHEEGDSVAYALCYADETVWLLSRGGSFVGSYVHAILRLGVKTDYTDDVVTGSGTLGIPFTLTSAPHPISRFGVVKTDGLEVIMKSDIYETINFKLIGDLGADETAEQTTSGNNGPGIKVNKTFVNLGIESNTVQYEITGSSTESEYGIEIYATNLWVTPSGGVTR